MFGNNPYGQIDVEIVAEMNRLIHDQDANVEEIAPASKRQSLWQMVKVWRNGLQASSEQTTAIDDDRCVVQC